MVKEGQSLHDRLVGNSNKAKIFFNSVPTVALVDTGSMISTVSHSFYKSLPNRPELYSLSDFGISLDVSVASGHSTLWLIFSISSAQVLTFGQGRK